MTEDELTQNELAYYWHRRAAEAETMLARAVHATDLTGDMWRKDALALLNRLAAHTEESG